MAHRPLAATFSAYSWCIRGLKEPQILNTVTYMYYRAKQSFFNYSFKIRRAGNVVVVYSSSPRKKGITTSRVGRRGEEGGGGGREGEGRGGE